MNNTSWFVLIICMIIHNANASHESSSMLPMQKTHPLVKQLKNLDLDDQNAVAWHANNIKTHGFTLRQLAEEYIHHKKNRALSEIQNELRISAEEMKTLYSHEEKIKEASHATGQIIGRMFYVAQGSQTRLTDAQEVKASYPVIYEALKTHRIQGIIHLRIHGRDSEPATLIATKKLFFNETCNMWQLAHESHIHIHKNFWLLNSDAQKALVNAELQAKLSHCSHVLPELILNHLERKLNLLPESRNNLAHSPGMQKLGRALELAECIIPACSSLQEATSMKHLISTYAQWALYNNKNGTADACVKLLRNVCVIEKLLYVEQELESKKS